MKISLYVIEALGARWAVLNIYYYALASQYGLKLINESGETIITVDESTYREIINPATNPPRTFVLDDSGIVFDPVEPPTNPPPEHSPECWSTPGPDCIESCPVVDWYREQNMGPPGSGD